MFNSTTCEEVGVTLKTLLTDKEPWKTKQSEGQNSFKI